MSLILSLHNHTPYALQPSSVDLRLVLENRGAKAVRGTEPGPGCLMTFDARDNPLNFLPPSPWPYPPKILELAPGARQTLELRSAAAGGVRDAGEYRVQCTWQGAASNVIRYRVLGERASYPASLRRVGERTFEVELVNRGSAAIDWQEPCVPEEDVSVFLGRTRVRTRIAGGAELVRVEAGARAVLRVEMLDVAQGQAIAARFKREPFVTGDVELVA